MPAQARHPRSTAIPQNCFRILTGPGPESSNWFRKPRTGCNPGQGPVRGRADHPAACLYVIPSDNWTDSSLGSLPVSNHWLLERRVPLAAQRQSQECLPLLRSYQSHDSHSSLFSHSSPFCNYPSHSSHCLPPADPVESTRHDVPLQQIPSSFSLSSPA